MQLLSEKNQPRKTALLYKVTLFGYNRTVIGKKAFCHDVLAVMPFKCGGSAVKHLNPV
jgi:hypothetical protein